jgi:hypothetical protein
VQKELRDHLERLGERSAEVRDSLVGSIAFHLVSIHALTPVNSTLSGLRSVFTLYG